MCSVVGIYFTSSFEPKRWKTNTSACPRKCMSSWWIEPRCRPFHIPLSSIVLCSSSTVLILHIRASPTRSLECFHNIDRAAISERSSGPKCTEGYDNIRIHLGERQHYNLRAKMAKRITSDDTVQIRMKTVFIFWYPTFFPLIYLYFKLHIHTHIEQSPKTWTEWMKIVIHGRLYQVDLAQTMISKWYQKIQKAQLFRRQFLRTRLHPKLSHSKPIPGQLRTKPVPRIHNKLSQAHPIARSLMQQITSSMPEDLPKIRARRTLVKIFCLRKAFETCPFNQHIPLGSPYPSRDKQAIHLKNRLLLPLASHVPHRNVDLTLKPRHLRLQRTRNLPPLRWRHCLNRLWDQKPYAKYARTGVFVKRACLGKYSLTHLIYFTKHLRQRQNLELG